MQNRPLSTLRLASSLALCIWAYSSQAQTASYSERAAVVDTDHTYISKRPPVAERLFRSSAVEETIDLITKQLTHPKLRWMFANCFPNTLDTTVHFGYDAEGKPETFVYTGDIAAMWLRDSGAQVWPYLQLIDQDPQLRALLVGTIREQLKLILRDPYANAFLYDMSESEFKDDWTTMLPGVHERKWEIDSLCYPIRLAFEYWKKTGDLQSIEDLLLPALEKVYATFREQQRKEGVGSYTFMRLGGAATDSKSNRGKGEPIKPVGLIVSSFRPSDDATHFQFLVPSNFFAVTSSRKAAEMIDASGKAPELAQEFRELASEVESALREYATYDHPKYGQIYAYEVDGFGNHYLMDDANVPSLLALPYLGDVAIDDPIYQNTRRYVLSTDNPYFFTGKAGEGIGGPHVGYDMVWPMSIMMRAFTSNDDTEIKDCLQMLLATDADTGLIHEAFHKDDATKYTRHWFAWQNTLFGELILKLIQNGKIDLLNSL